MTRKRIVLVDTPDSLVGKCAFSLKAQLSSGRYVVECECDSAQWTWLEARHRDALDTLDVVPSMTAPADTMPQELKDELTGATAKQPARAQEFTLGPRDDVLVGLRKVRAAIGLSHDEWPVDKEF